MRCMGWSRQGLTAWDVLNLFLEGCSDRSDDGARSFSSSIDAARSDGQKRRRSGNGRYHATSWISGFRYRPMGWFQWLCLSVPDLLQDTNLSLGSAQQPRIDPRRTGGHRHVETQTHSRSTGHARCEQAGKQARRCNAAAAGAGPGPGPGPGLWDLQKGDARGEGEGCSGDKESIKWHARLTGRRWITRAARTWSEFLGLARCQFFILSGKENKLNWSMTSESQKTRGNCGDGMRRVRASNPKKGQRPGGRGSKAGRLCLRVCAFAHVNAGNPGPEIHSFLRTILEPCTSLSDSLTV